jgi:hypothetical protein
MKLGTLPPLRSVSLLDQMRERIRYRHYRLRTEQAYLATELHVARSTHKQALAALLFLYRQVLDIELPWMQQTGRPRVRFEFRRAVARSSSCARARVERDRLVMLPKPLIIRCAGSSSIRVRFGHSDVSTTMILLSSSAAGARSPASAINWHR